MTRTVDMAQQQRILILGLGVSGLAAAELAAAQGHDVVVLDSGHTPVLEDRATTLAARDVRVHLEWSEPSWPNPVDEAIISPGIRVDSALGRCAQALSCPVISELEFGFRHCSCPLLAVTGTNGKTTTVELLGHCLRHSGVRTAEAGNIGRPLSEAARRSAALDVLVVEVSSFQLEAIRDFAPLAVAILNITPDHLDRHGNFETYAAVKSRLAAAVPQSDHIVLRADLLPVPCIRDALPRDGCVPVVVGRADTDGVAFFEDDEGYLCRQRSGNAPERLLHGDDLKLMGQHNRENALFALALADTGGWPAETLAPYAGSFTPGAHRLELVAMHDGVRYINDSKSTNADALRQAVRTVAAQTRGRILLLAGGVPKDLDFRELADDLRGPVREAFLVGSCRKQLAEDWQNAVSCKIFISLSAAFDAAAESAQPGDTILLSPGCASFDMFSNYVERGRKFRALVKRRVGE